MMLFTSKTKAVRHFIANTTPRTGSIIVGASLMIIGSGMGVVAAQQPSQSAADTTKAKPTATVPAQDSFVSQVAGVQTTQPAANTPPVPTSTKAKPATKGTSNTAQSTASSAVKPAAQTPAAATPGAPATPAQPASYTNPTSISIARGSSATVTFTATEAVTWYPFFKNFVLSDGYSESPAAPYQTVLPYASGETYHASAITFVVTVDATAPVGDTNEVALFMQFDSGVGMTKTAKLTIL